MKWLNSLISQIEKSLKEKKRVDDRILRICKRKKGYQYYLEEKGGKRSYVRVSELEEARKVAQKEYETALLTKLVKLQKRLDQFLRLYDIEAIENEYNNLCEAKKLLVYPIVMTNEEFVRQWEEENGGSMNPFPEQGQYKTEKGEFVRSKSEKILADLFRKKEIPYVYEPKVELWRGNSVYPDFALLNVRKRKTLYWEHFGLIADGDYARKTLQKLNAYEKSGIIIGEDLIFTMESDAMPLNFEQIERKIDKYLL